MTGGECVGAGVVCELQLVEVGQEDGRSWVVESKIASRDAEEITRCRDGMFPSSMCIVLGEDTQKRRCYPWGT